MGKFLVKTRISHILDYIVEADSQEEAKSIMERHLSDEDSDFYEYEIDQRCEGETVIEVNPLPGHMNSRKFIRKPFSFVSGDDSIC